MQEPDYDLEVEPYPPAEEIEPEQPRPRWTLGRVFTWLAVLAAIVLLGFGGRVLGERYHNPPSRIPAPVEAPARGLLGVNEPVLRAQERVEQLIGDPAALTLAGDAYQIDFPRSVADRLFGKRDESATIFPVSTAEGRRLRVLALRPQDEPTVFAVEPSEADEGVAGVYVGLPAASPPELRQALVSLLAEANAGDKENLSWSDYTIFGPFLQGDAGELRERIEGNTVLAHLAALLEDSPVSLAAPVFLVREAPDEGTVRGIYQSGLSTVYEPLWGSGSTSVLAHELVHAAMDHVVEDKDAVLEEVAGYMEEAHPRLFGRVIGDLYERLDGRGRAEEALAFIAGSIATEQTRTVATARLLANENLLDFADPILTSDVELLLALGLLPSCMSPEPLGQTERELWFSYYEAVREACR